MFPPAVNAYVQPVTEFGGDPAESWVRRLVTDAINRLQGRFGQAAVLGFDGDPETSLGGTLTGSPQSFIGAASRATTNVTNRDGAYPSMSSGVVTGPMGDPARRILANRLTRGQGY